MKDKSSKMNHENNGSSSPQPSDNSSAAIVHTKIQSKRKRNTGVHLNNLWSVWYGLFGTAIQAYIIVKSIKRILGCSLYSWPEDISIPYLELNCSLGLIGAALLLLPLFLTTAMFKVGNLANDGFKLGRQLGTCSKEPPSEVVTNGGRCSLFRHGGPTAPFVHLVIAFCLLVPKLLMEAKLIEAGFLSQDWIWKTDLDFLVVQRDRQVVLSFTTSSNGTHGSPSSISQARVIAATKAPPAMATYNPGVSFTHSMPVTHTVIKTLKHFIGHENHTAFYNNPDGSWGHSLSNEYINLIVALMVYSVRYPAIFWSTNKCLGFTFSFQLLINSIHILLGFAGMSILYKVQVAGVWKSLPLLKHSSSYLLQHGNNTPFLLNAQVTLCLYLLSTMLVLAASLVLYLYGHTRFNEFLNHETERKVIMLKRENSNKWSYFTHCAALCVLVSVGICNAPLLHDYTFVYKGSLDDITLACIIAGILHLFLWVVIWLFLTIKQKWIFKLRVVVGRATVRQARSMRLITDIDLSANRKDAPEEPLLVVANGRTYGVSDTSPQKAIMNIVKKSTTIKKAVSKDTTLNELDDEEQIYWLRPAISSQPCSPDSAKQFCCFSSKKEKQKVTFSETTSTSNIRGKNGGRSNRVPRMDQDDGDYATLRELPIAPLHRPKTNNNENDTISEEGKLLACVRDEHITYASTNQDLNPPLDYEDPSPLLTPEPLPDIDDISQIIPTPVVIHNSSSVQPIAAQTPRCLRRADSGMPHEELNSRSDSISTQSSVSPPEHPESSHSETSSGVHSNDSRDHPPPPPRTRRATSVVDLMQPQIREEIQWKSSSLQRNMAAPGSSNFNMHGSPPLPQRRSHDVDMSTNVILEDPGDTTVIIRRKSFRPNPETIQGVVLKEEPFGRATNMRMISFTEKTNLENMQASSATLPHYPTQPVQPNPYPHCSTMPLPPHTSQNISSNLNTGNNTSCNIYTRQHTTLPTHHNGIALFNNGAPHQQPSQYSMQMRLPCKQDMSKTDLIYSRIYRNSNVMYHPNS